MSLWRSALRVLADQLPGVLELALVAAITCHNTCMTMEETL